MKKPNPQFVEGRRKALGLGGGMVALAALGSRSAHAAVPTIMAGTTNLTARADRMISYRFQERMWQTPDGGTHLIINRGSLSPAGALNMCTSFDNGQTWTVAAVLPNTDYTSTCDGQLVGNDLNLVYSTTTLQIQQASLRYNPDARTWTRTGNWPIYAATDVTALSPSIVTDNIGAQWCAYVTQNNTTLETVIKLSFRNRFGAPWADTGLLFGVVDNQPVERAGRLVRLANGVGMIYTWHDDIYWAVRTDGAQIVTPWTTTLIWRSDPPGSGGRGEWGGPYSVVADELGNLHMATVDAGRIVYFRYLAQTGQWEPLRALSGDVSAAYTQVTYCNGRLLVSGNIQSQARVFQSDDLGTTFRVTANLKHEVGGSGVDYSSPRLQSPSVSRDPVPMLQLYSTGITQKLMYFSVPLAP